MLGYGDRTPQCQVKNSYLVLTANNTVIIRHDCYFAHYTGAPSLSFDINDDDVLKFEAKSYESDIPDKTIDFNDVELPSKMSLRPRQDKDYKSMNRGYITSIPNDNMVQSRPKLVLNKLLVDHDKTLVTKWFNSKLRINDDISKLGNDLFQEACVFVA